MALCKTAGKHVLRCMRCRLPLLTSISRGMTSLEYEKDQHNGVTVNLAQLPSSTTEQQFHTQLKECLQSWQVEDRSAVWLQVPLTHSRLIAAAVDHGFTFHHAEGDKAMLKLWLHPSQSDRTPRFATHQIGASGFVVREDLQQVLVIKDKNSKFNLWKFPGGLSDLGEDIGDTAVREVFEETGVKSEFQSILAFRQQHQQPGAFGRSDIYVVCRLRPLTFELSPCSAEVKACQWMPLEQLQNEMARSPITKRLVDIARFGLEEGFDNVDILSEQMASVYKGLTYKLYHRSLPNNWKV
ncbi:nucleoside diphosphate-linked moiety X motif 6-like [Haliotis rubra]|uniref:nucleoside diphosphate-linked moiety X motif 6-like n=1 Tax=Haliotis rubra TaxID=36100 RepID=UPI001EE4F1A3|nr:nucleoside diphosphate-linked moiety X motif 6-like [Haliotis rubra]